MSGEPRCRLCALITLRAVDSDLEFAAPRAASLPDGAQSQANESIASEGDEQVLKGRTSAAEVLSMLAHFSTCAAAVQQRWPTSRLYDTAQRLSAGVGRLL